MEKLVRTTLAAVLALAASACGDDDGATDTGTPDTGMPDTGTGDTGTGDTGTGDTGTGDGGDGSVSRCGADGLELPGDAFYPEGIAIGGDGTVYVGSLATGEVVRFPGGTGPAETFVASGGALTNTVGLLYDSARSIIWACTSNLTTFAARRSSASTRLTVRSPPFSRSTTTLCPTSSAARTACFTADP
jgi:hypothetical protein